MIKKSTEDNGATVVAPLISFNNGKLLIGKLRTARDHIRIFAV